jgi:hypothetical protein
MLQKFRKNTFVRVCDDMPEHMSHFTCGVDAIVSNTYSQANGGKDVKSYSLYLIKDGRIYNPCAWYDEDQLALLEKHSYEDAEQMIEDYNLR